MSKILIIDDEPDVLEVVSLRLTKHGHHVICAQSGQEGLESLKIEKPDLILLDVRMPHEDGYDICSKIRGMENLERTPIVFFTATGDNDRKVFEMCKEMGAQGYIIKPFEAADFIEKIDGYLSKAA